MLIDEKATLRSEGIFEWENELCDGLWSYSLASIERGVQYCFVTLAENYEKVIQFSLRRTTYKSTARHPHGHTDTRRKIDARKFYENADLFRTRGTRDQL